MSESSEHSSQAEMSLSISPPPPTNMSEQDISQSQNQQSSNEVDSSDAPWRGILRKTESKINLNE